MFDWSSETWRKVAYGAIMAVMAGMAGLAIHQQNDPVYMARYRGRGSVPNFALHVPPKCILPAYVMMQGQLEADLSAYNADRVTEFVKACGGRIEQLPDRPE
jgi:hypothetical protein